MTLSWSTTAPSKPRITMIHHHHWHLIKNPLWSTKLKTQNKLNQLPLVHLNHPNQKSRPNLTNHHYDKKPRSTPQSTNPKIRSTNQPWPKNLRTYHIIVTRVIIDTTHPQEPLRERERERQQLSSNSLLYQVDTISNLLTLAT